MDTAPACIALPAPSLANLVHAAYADGDGDPERYVRHLLAPYYVTAAQVEELARELHWPGRPHVSHPLYAVVREMRQLSAPRERRCLDAVNRERFVSLATSISHIWLVAEPTKRGGGLRRICTYQGVNAPIPHAWLHVDGQGVVTLCAASPGMPALALSVKRSCRLGYLAPLDLDLNVEHGSSHGCSYLNFYVDVDGSALDAEQWASSSSSGSNDTPTNYALLFTRSAPVCQLSKALLVSPSLQRTWSLPVVVHAFTLPDSSTL